MKTGNFIFLLSLLAVVLVEPYQGRCQPGTLVWSHRFSAQGDNTDRFLDGADYNGSGFVVTGFSVKQGNYKDVLTARLSLQGDTIWWRTKNGDGNSNDQGVSVAADFFGNIYVAGTTDNGNRQDDIYLLKYDQSGNLLWDTTWNSTAFLDDETVDMMLDGSGNILVVGNVEPDVVPGSSDIVTLKFSPSGGLLWQSIYNNSAVVSGKDEAAAMVLDVNGNAYVCGRTFGLTSDYDYITMKVDGASGNRLWSVTYNNSVVNGDDRAADICLDNAGNVLVTGRSDNGSNDDVRTVKYEPVNGILQWTKFYAGSLQQNDRGSCITVDATDNVYVAGQTDVNSSTLTNYDFLVLKYNSAGTILWTRIDGYSALQNDIPLDMMVFNNSNLVVTGSSDVNADPAISDDVARTYLYSLSGGAPIWQDAAAGSRPNSDTEPFRIIASSADSNIHVVGYMENTSTQGDGLCLTYSIAGQRLNTKSHNGTGDFTSVFNRTRPLNPILSQTINAGYAYQEGQERDALLEVVSNGGQSICDYRYNGSANEDDVFEALAVDYASNMVYAAGYTKISGQKSDFLLVKFNPSTCDTVWTRTYNHSSSQSDRLVDVVIDLNGDIFVTGKSDSDINDTLDNNDVVTMKYSAAGNLLWTQRFNGSGNLRDEPMKIMIARNGDIVVSGRTESAQNDDVFVLRYYPATGSQVWTAPVFYNSSFGNDDRALDMVVDGVDNIFISGYSQTGQGTSPDDAFVIRVSSQGAVNAIFNFDGIGNGEDQGSSVTVDPSNNVYLAARSDQNADPLLNDYSIVVMKLDNSLASLLWNSSCVISSPLGGDAAPVDMEYYGTDLFLAGYSEYSDQFTNDMLVARIDGLGQVSWMQTYDGPASAEDESTSIAFDNSGSGLFISGFSDGLPTRQADGVLLRYELPTAINTIDRNGSISVFPNPSCTWLSWKSDLAINKITMLDMAGRQVLTAYPDVDAAIDVSTLSSGMYQILLSTQQGIVVKSVSIQSHD